jgi:flagellar hook assembly protein FlgD
MLSVYDISGRRVAVLADRFLPAGKHEVRWDGTDSASRPLSSGVYFVLLDAGGDSRSGKLVLLK